MGNDSAEKRLGDGPVEEKYRETIADVLGPRCTTFDAQCMTCVAWAMSDELERLERERSEWAGVAATRNVNIAILGSERDRMLNAIVGYVRSTKAGAGEKAVWWWELQEIEKELGARAVEPRLAHDGR